MLCYGQVENLRQIFVDRKMTLRLFLYYANTYLLFRTYNHLHFKNLILKIFI